MKTNKNSIIIGIGSIIYIIITAITILFFRYGNLTLIENRILQNASYATILLITILLMRKTKYKLSEFGLCMKKLPKQLLIGASIGTVLVLITMLMGKYPVTTQDYAYILLSQLLVAITEETFFRGFILYMLKEITSSRDKAVFISSLFFALVHIPINFSIGQVIMAFLIGIILAVIRTEFEDHIFIPCLVIIHLIMNML